MARRKKKKRYRQVPEKVDPIIQSYLNLQSTSQNRGNVLCFVLLFLDFIGMMPIISVPFSMPYFLATGIPVLLINLWAIPFVVNPEKYEQPYYLFIGVYGIVNTYVYYVAIQKMLYLNLDVQGTLPFMVGAILLIGLLIFVNWLNLKALYSGTYYRLQNSKKGNIGLIAGIPGLSYVIGQFLLTFFTSDEAVFSMMIILLSILSIVTAYMSIYIHRYFFILKHMEDVKKLYPNFGMDTRKK